MTVDETTDVQKPAVFISYLGLGVRAPAEPVDYQYQDTRYDASCVARTTFAVDTPYVQEAILAGFKRAGQLPDQTLLLTTELSKEWHWQKAGRLQARLQQSVPEVLDPGRLEVVDISDSVAVAEQWQTFEKILARVPSGCSLYIDMTHGFRALPILLSAATSLLQQVKGVELAGVFYGAFEPRKQTPTEGFPIVDMARFYVVNQWAGAVTRLVEQADARPLAHLARAPHQFQVAALRDEKLLTGLERLSLAIRNVEANAVAGVAREVLQLVSAARTSGGATVTDHLLLELVEQRLSELGSTSAPTGTYDKAYFDTQLALVRALSDHQLYVQAFTVMRELVGSVGVLGYPKYRDKKPLEARKYADVFVNMCQFDPWDTAKVHVSQTEMRGKLLPFQAKLEEVELMAPLREVTREIADLRNAFNHAWMSKQLPKATSDHVPAVAQRCAQVLGVVVERLEHHGLFRFVPPSPGPAREGVFVNLSNHPVSEWSDAQVAAARGLGLGDIVEIDEGMPTVDPTLDGAKAQELADHIVERAVRQEARGAHVAGESVLSFCLVRELQRRRIKCFAATTARQVKQHIEAGVATTTRVFEFVRWREYPRD